MLLVERAGFPIDTIATHLVHAPGVAALASWGLLDRLVASGCPPITSYSYDFGPFVLSGSPLPTDGGIAVGYGPRRTVLDRILLDGAVEAGVEVRENFTVEERAELVIGADGRGERWGRCRLMTA